MPIPLKLTVYKGSDLIGEHRFDRDIVKIGRLASAHLKLEDTKVSRIHAVIEATSDGQDYSIIDMGSTEGTFVNGEKVSKEKLREGDEIRLGDCRLVVSFDETDVKLPAPEVVPPTGDTIPAFSAPGGAASPAELWAASPQDLAGAVPTMTLAPVSPFAVGQPSGASAATLPPAGTFAPPERGQSIPGMVPMGFGSNTSPGFASPYAMGTVPQGAPMQQPQQSGDVWAVNTLSGIPAYNTGSMAPMMPAGMMPPQGVMPQGVMPQGMGPQGMMPQGMSVAPMQVMPMAYDAAYPSPPASGVRDLPISGLPIPVLSVRPTPWGSVPNNLASDGVPESERSLEIKTLWGNSVLDTLNVVDKPVVTLGDERKTTGWGPFQQLVRCDIEVPSKGLPSPTFVLATSLSPQGCSYGINIPSSFTGRLEKADGTAIPLTELRGVERDGPGVSRYNLGPAETLYLEHGGVSFQLRYVRRARLIPPGFWAEMNYTWVNMLILAFFVHSMAIVSFMATPQTTAELTESLFKNPNRFAQFRLTPEEKKKQQNDFLSKLKEGAAGAKARGQEGKAGKKDYKGKQGRMAVKGDPNDKEIAKSTLAKLFGAKGNTGRSYLFGSGGLGGELKGALGGVTGAEIGDATGLGGLGTRGSGPGGGGLSMNSVGLGALGTAGRGGGNGGYGEGVGGLGKKTDRDINISAGSPIIMGSLDKEIIRRVIKEHMQQIRYCYEKELIRSPGLFGKVATQFTISAAGTVQSAEVSQSTMNNPEVERCITSKIRTWVFPKPKGGGVVIVKYPFIFKTSG